MKNDTVKQNAGDTGPAKQEVFAVSYAASLRSIEEQNEVTGQRRAGNASIRELIRNARFTGALLSAVLKELEGESLDDFCRHTGADVETGNSLAGMATELGSTYTKDIRLDLVFEYTAGNSLMLRIDEEPQTTQKSFNERNLQSYSLTARAVYYAALAMATQLQSGEEYYKIRKVYSIWLCYERPIPEMQEPVIRYSLRPDEEYAYRDGVPLSDCKRKFDSGDLMGIVLVSVPDVERIYGDSRLLNSSRYNAETITVLYHLLSERTSSRQRKRFYYERGIIVPGSEEESTVSGNEELRSINEEIRSINEEIRIENEEMRVENEEMRVENEEMRVENEEMRVENEAMRVENEAMRVENEAMLAETEKLRIEVEVSRAREEESKKEAEELRKRVEELEKKIEKLGV